MTHIKKPAVWVAGLVIALIVATQARIPGLAQLADHLQQHAPDQSLQGAQDTYIGTVAAFVIVGLVLLWCFTSGGKR